MIETKYIYDQQAEHSILGCILIDNKSINEIMFGLSPDDFYCDTHKDIYRIMIEMYKNNQIIDNHSILEKMKYNIEPASYIYEVETLLRLKHYINRIKQKSIIRQILNICYETIDKIPNIDDVDSFLYSISSNLYKLTTNKNLNKIKHIKEVTHDIVHTAEELNHNSIKFSNIPTGFGNLDRCIGGLEPQNLIVLAARPSVGKTSFAMNIAHNVAALKKSVLIFSLEMSINELATKFLSTKSEIPTYNIKSGHIEDNEWSRLIESSKYFYNQNIYIDDTGNITPMEMRAKAIKLSMDVKIDLIIIDYIQRIYLKGRKENRNNEISEITRDIKNIAKELNVPILLLAQLSREVEKRGTNARPKLSDLRDSGCIEADADIVIMLHREGDIKEQINNNLKNEVEFLVEKNRNGALKIFKLDFIKPYTKFQEQYI